MLGEGAGLFQVCDDLEAKLNGTLLVAFNKAQVQHCQCYFDEKFQMYNSEFLDLEDPKNKDPACDFDMNRFSECLDKKQSGKKITVHTFYHY